MSRASGLYWQHAHHQTGSICTATCSQAKWDRCVNTRIRKVEVQTSAARLPADWNIATGSFLRRCGPPPLPLPPPGQSRCLFATVLLQQHDTVPTTLFWLESPLLRSRRSCGAVPALWADTCSCANGMVHAFSKRLGHGA